MGTSAGGLKDQIAKAQLKSADIVKEENQIDERSDLLAQIRKGRQLKKVQQNTKNDTKRKMSGIGGILENAMDQRFKKWTQNSDSDSDDNDDHDSDDGWSDDE